MKATEFVGIIPPLLSSFTKEGEIYEKGTRELVGFTFPFMHGYYPIGTYRCGPLMSTEERKRVLTIILDEVNGRVPIVTHVGHSGTQPTIELARHAKEAGAAGVGVISPYYSPHLPEENLYHHFASLIDAVNEDDFDDTNYFNPDVVDMVYDEIMRLGFLRGLMYVRFLDTLVHDRWYERKLFAETLLAAEDIRALHQIRELMGLSSTSFILIGMKRRCRIYEHFLKTKVSLECNVSMITEEADIDQLSIQGCFLLQKRREFFDVEVSSYTVMTEMFLSEDTSSKYMGANTDIPCLCTLFRLNA
jgi:hypothetical protein